LIKRAQAPKETKPSDLFVNEKSTQAQESGATGQQGQVTSRKAVRFAESLPLRDLPAPGPEKNTSIFAPAEVEVHEANPQNGEMIKRELSYVKGSIDPVVQSNLIQAGKARLSNAPNAPLAMPTPSLTFEGLSSIDNVNASGGSTVMPPDTVGDVGPNEYMQGTNFLFNVYNKTTGAQQLPGGRKYSQLFAPLGGICSTRNDGDPIVLYDQMADRWMISQFCVANDPFNHQLIAISKTGAATGAYYLYDFQMPNIHFQDYPHFGIWHDGYYMTANLFQSASNVVFYGAGAFAYDRTRMLAGDPAASMIVIDETTVDPTAGGQLPTDADGFVAPPTSVPQLICEFRDTEFGDPIDGLRCFEFKPNFDNPGSTTFTQLADFPTAPFDGRNPGGRVDVEQPSPATAAHNLDSLGGRLMNRLVYRNQGTAAAPDNRWVTNWTVNVSGVVPNTASTYQAGVRWTEFTRSAANVMSVRDQGTYVNGPISGTTGENDWMASAAQDNQGNIAVGFSGSSTTLMPAIKWAGRTGAAPTGTLNEGEATMFNSTGVQSATNSRWGDYSSMNTDPVDDCSFWYTTEYRLAANNSAAGSFPFFWNTRVGTFKFPACTTSPRGQLTGTVTDSNNNPVANAIVTTSNGYFRMTNASGQYTIDPMGVDSYTVTAFKRGIGAGPATAPATILNGNITVLNLQLPAAADVVLVTPTVTEGTFSNGNGHVDPGETGNVVITLNNPSASVAATNVTATLTVKNPTAGVKVAEPTTRNFGTIAPGASATNSGAPFKFTLAAQTPVATTIEFVLRVDFGGGQTPTFLYFSYFVGINNPAFAVIPNTTLDTTPPSLPAGAISATTGTQTGRLSRSGVSSGCGTAKANPGIIAGDTTARQYDAYTYANNTIDILCVTVSVNQTGTELYTAAYGAGGFVPANPATNFLGDPGSSSATMSYSFDVPPNSNFTIVVHDVTPPAGIGKSYNATLSAVAYSLPPVRRRADFDVDLKSDVSVFRPSEGNWYYRNSSTGVIQKTFWGTATDKPVPGDYDGDGQTDFAVFRPSENNWYIRNSFDGTGMVKSFGTTGDVPVPGDYDGDGKTDVAVFRPSEGKWYYLGSFANTLSFQAWGISTDKLVPADYDGDGKTDFAVFRPSDGNWYVRKSTGGSTITNWGLSTDVLVPHDYDGDRKADLAVFRPSEGNWYIRKSTGGVTIQNWGNSTDVPVPADYDGDNKADIAVWRDFEGNWYILNSTGSPAVTILNLGNPGDRPVSRDYIPTP
jgi:putative transposon-encoded protein